MKFDGFGDDPDTVAEVSTQARKDEEANSLGRRKGVRAFLLGASGSSANLLVTSLAESSPWSLKH